MSRVEHDPTTGQLDIWFTASGRYSYYAVPTDIYERLLSARSKGQFYNDHIRDRYDRS